VTGIIDHERAFWGDPAAEPVSLEICGPVSDGVGDDGLVEDGQHAFVDAFAIGKNRLPSPATTITALSTTSLPFDESRGHRGLRGFSWWLVSGVTVYARDVTAAASPAILSRRATPRRLSAASHPDGAMRV
jgi:hypothetical protein